MDAINPYSSIGQAQRPGFSPAFTDRALDRSLPAPPREAEAPSRPLAPSAEPTDLRSRLDDLIAGEVTSGRLTIGQAEDLRSVFDDTFSDGPAPPPSRASGQPDTMDSPYSIDRMTAASFDPAAFASKTNEVESTATVMQRFLAALQASVESSAVATYGASGQNSVAAIKTVPPLLVDYRT